MTISLYLKLKPGEGTNASFEVNRLTHCLQLDENSYKFTQIFEDEQQLSSIIENNDSNVYVFVGPTGAGKTTSVFNVLKNLDFKGEITAFEMNNNKKFIDLLDNKNLKLKLNELDKQIFTKLLITNIFNSRSTSKTNSNPTSSRSCLIITLYYQKHYITFIDLMGNEKFEMNQSNIFANVNMSSITSKLINNHSTNNSITNLIFDGNHKVNIIVNLDPFGETGLIKSTLNNIASLVTEFKQQPTANQLENYNDKLPSYARPTNSSAVRISPIKPFARSISRSPSKSPSKSPSRSLTKSPSRSPSKLKTLPTPTVRHNRISTLSSLNLSTVDRNLTKSTAMIKERIKPQSPSLNSTLKGSKIDYSRSLVAAKLSAERNSPNVIRVGTRKTMRELELELKGLRNENSDLLNDNTKIVKENEDLKIQLTQLNTSLSQTQEQVGQLTECIDQMNNKLNVQKVEITELDSEKASLNLKLQDSVNQLKQVQYESERIVTEKEEQINALNTQLQEVICASTKKLDSLKVENERISENVLKLQKINENSVATISNLEDANSCLKADISNLKSSHEELTKSHADKISELNTKNSEMDSTISELESRIKSLNSELAEMTSLKDTLNDEIKQLKESLSDSELKSADNLILKSQNQELTRELEAASQKNQSYSVEIADLNEEYASLKEQLKIAKDESETFTKVNNDKLRGLEDQNQTLEERLQQLEKEKETLQNKVDQIKHQYENLQKKLSSDNQQVEQLQSRIVTLSDKLEHKSSKLDSKQQKIHDLQKELDEKTADIRKSNIELDQVKFDNMTKIKELQSLIKEKDDEISRLNSQIDQEMNYPSLNNITNFSGRDIFDDSSLDDDKENVEEVKSYKKSSPSKILVPKNDNYKSIVNSLTKEKLLKRKSSSIKSNKPKIPKLKY